MAKYYAFVNNLPLIDSKSLKFLTRTLKMYYPTVGQVTIVDQTNKVVSRLNLSGKRIIKMPQVPTLDLIAAISQSAFNGNILVQTQNLTNEERPSANCSDQSTID